MRHTWYSAVVRRVRFLRYPSRTLRTGLVTCGQPNATAACTGTCESTLTETSTSSTEEEVSGVSTSRRSFYQQELARRRCRAREANSSWFPKNRLRAADADVRWASLSYERT